VRYDRGMSLPIEAGRSELERRLGKETPCPQLFSTLAGGCLYSFIHRESEKAHSRKPRFRYTGFSETRFPASDILGSSSALAGFLLRKGRLDSKPPRVVFGR
jgi:hypothetical protein